jgi:hypothetical protein
VKCAVVSLYSVVKQGLQCNTGKVCNCLIQFLLSMDLSIEERIFISAQRLSESTVYYQCNYGNKYVSRVSGNRRVTRYILQAFLLLNSYVAT